MYDFAFFGQEKIPGCFVSVIRWLELVSEPSVLAGKTIASPTVSGSVVFGKHITGGLIIISPERCCTVMVKCGGEREAK